MEKRDDKKKVGFKVKQYTYNINSALMYDKTNRTMCLCYVSINDPKNWDKNIHMYMQMA